MRLERVRDGGSVDGFVFLAGPLFCERLADSPRPRQLIRTCPPPRPTRRPPCDSANHHPNAPLRLTTRAAAHCRCCHRAAAPQHHFHFTPPRAFN